LKNIYVDITELYLWRGKATGIIRVIEEIAIQIAKDNDVDATFIVWSGHLRSFCKVDLAEAIASSQTESKRKSSKAANLKKPTVINGVRIPLSRTVKKIIIRPKAETIKLPSRKYKVKIQPNSIMFMPHGGVWSSSKYLKEVLSLNKTKAVDLVPIIYDFSPVVQPQFCSHGIRKVFKQHMRNLLPKAKLILSISENTAKDGKEWLESYGVSNPNIKTIRLGDEISSNISGVKPPKKELPSNFILCVGTIEARKNHASLYYAYKLASENNLDLAPIVLVGRKGWLAEDIYEEMTVDPSLKDKFIFLHNTSDGEMVWLYQNAMFSVYPSFYEGWGLPVAESLARGVPCIASNTSSIPEIAGDLIDYFSPYSPEEVMKTINHYCIDKELLKSKRSEVVSKYKTTTWDSTYREIIQLLAEL